MAHVLLAAPDRPNEFVVVTAPMRHQQGGRCHGDSSRCHCRRHRDGATQQTTTQLNKSHKPTQRDETGERSRTTI
eukprot:scaffold3953_cov169-Amphora_coffeaeformis.AAC.18